MTENKKRIHYAWVVFGACFFMIFIALGFGSSTKGTYLTAITDQLGLKRSLFTINDSLRYITTAVMNMIFGACVAKVGPRRMTSFGFLFLTISFTVYSFATQLWQFYIGGVFLGAGLAWTTTTIVGVIVEKWFTSSKGTVMGIILAANGLGGAASEQIITRIIYGADGTLSVADARWRLAYRVTAVLFVLTGILVVSLIREKPEDKGLKPLGSGSIVKKKNGDWEGYAIAEVLRKPYFYVTGACVFFMGFILQSMDNVAKPHMYDAGLSKEFVLYVFSIHALVLAASKVIAGFCNDRFGTRVTYAFCTVAAVISIGALIGVSSGSTVLPWVFSVVSSLALPIETVMIPLVARQMFGSRPFASVMGYYLGLNTLGYACGVPLANLSYDLTGSYQTALILMVIVMAAAAAVQQISMAVAARARRRMEAAES